MAAARGKHGRGAGRSRGHATSDRRRRRNCRHGGAPPARFRARLDDVGGFVHRVAGGAVDLGMACGFQQRMGVDRDVVAVDEGAAVGRPGGQGGGVVAARAGLFPDLGARQLGTLPGVADAFVGGLKLLLGNVAAQASCRRARQARADRGGRRLRLLGVAGRALLLRAPDPIPPVGTPARPLRFRASASARRAGTGSRPGRRQSTGRRRRPSRARRWPPQASAASASPFASVTRAS